MAQPLRSLSASTVSGVMACRHLLSGNIQVDADHLDHPGNVIVDGPSEDAMNSLKAIATVPAMATICGRN